MNKKNPPTSGFYWIIEDIGISVIRNICLVKVSPQGVELLSTGFEGPIKWDENRHLGWNGPLTRPECFINSSNGEELNWSSL